ncbi:MAG: TIGR04141 family sporadically distributed protein [Paludibacteraceae bacterium]|nr:TIGR04141 family sporadically distributed protein [Paludibacteraceae bacterium]
MAKSRSFSIYLLKETFNPENSLKENHGMELLQETKTNLPDDAIMYIADNVEKQPWWKCYWGIKKNLFQTQKGALLFLPVNKRWMVMTFGMTYHQLRDNAYEYDFGIRTTLNALNPEKVKSTDILKPENAKRQRIQVPVASNLNYFDFRQDETIIKRLTGAVKAEYSSLFKNVTGSNCFRFSSNKQPNEIIDLCSQLLDIYLREDFKDSFPDIQNVVPIKDPDDIDKLNGKLIEAFSSTTSNNDIMLSIPDIFDHDNSNKIKFSGAGQSSLEFEDVSFENYKQYIGSKNITIDNITKLRKHYIVILNEDDYEIKRYSVYNSVFFDCTIDDKTYHLCDGDWYLVNSEYIQKVNSYIDSYFADNIDFLADCNKKREDEYNSAMSNDNVICLDKTNIAPDNQTNVEPCDLITDYDDILQMAHIKISTRSANLSHLFNQGLNSVELLRGEEESCNKLKQLVDDKVNYLSMIDEKKFGVIYGIITSKDRSDKSKNLPIFSRISLMRTLKTLQIMGIPCKVYFIKDLVNRNQPCADNNN